MSQINDDLEIYLNKEFPLIFPQNSIYSKTIVGEELFKVEQVYKRRIAAKHFIAGYMAGFKEGNKSLVSDFTVASPSNIIDGNK